MLTEPMTSAFNSEAAVRLVKFGLEFHGAAKTCCNDLGSHFTFHSATGCFAPPKPV